jgi:hypothetical protein
LEAEVTNLKRQVHSYQHYQRHGLTTLNRPDYWRIAYLEGKLRRQAEAITKMQKKGWQPQLIIREVPDGEHPWDAPKPQSKRRPKRRPTFLIKEEV